MRFYKRKRLMVGLLTVVTLLVPACTSRDGSMTESELTDFATGYAAAWSGQDPQALAAHYAEKGTLTVNEGIPSAGREAIAAKAKSFMTAFPDMVVSLDRVIKTEGGAEFHWIWTGTNTGPGGTGNAVRITGYEEWTLDADGLILESEGHYDEVEFQRQVNGEVDEG